MSRNDDDNRFDFDPDEGWTGTISFPEFKPFNVAALTDFANRHQLKPPVAAPVPQSAETGIIRVMGSDGEDDDDDSVEVLNRLFENGEFRVSFDASLGFSEDLEPTPAQARAFDWLLEHRAEVFRILLDHAYRHYNEHVDEFRDFFNGEPADREILFPQIASPDGMRQMLRLMTIDIHEQTRDGRAMITFNFDNTWLDADLWEVTLCGEQIVELKSAPFPFRVPKILAWEKLPVSRGGLRFVEFLYRRVWTGTFTIDAQGVCDRQIWCPACNGLVVLDPELIEGIRDASSAHMIATLVHKTGLNEWVRPALMLVAPTCFALGWWWNPAFYWGTFVVSLLAVAISFLDAGWRWRGWATLGLIEAGLTFLARLPKREAPKFDEVPDWTLLNLFENFVWLTSAAIAGAWMFGLIGISKHRTLRPTFWILLAFGIAQISAVAFVAVSEYSALHLLWFTPLALLLTVLAAIKRFQYSLKQSMLQSLGGDMGGQVEDVCRQIQEQMKRQSGGGTVFESRSGSKKNSSDDES